ncbi:hypothetical protein OROMI_026167 [Orobanche minor]
MKSAFQITNQAESLCYPLFLALTLGKRNPISLFITVTDELEVSSSSRAVQVLQHPDAAATLEIRGCGPLSRNLDRSSVLWIIHDQPVKLHGLGLTGNLGVELSNLKSLKNMDLSANNIEGSFPYSLPPILTNLNLGHNFLTGLLDDVLNGLENLKLIASDLIRIFVKPHRFLQNNQFTGLVIFLANLSLCTGVDFTLMSVQDSPHMSAFSSSPMITPSRLPPVRTKTLKVSRRKSFSKSKTIISAKAYTVAKLQIATNNFSEKNLISEGSLGSVYRAEFPDGTVQYKKKLLVVHDFKTGSCLITSSAAAEHVVWDATFSFKG